MKLTRFESSISHLGCVEYCTALVLHRFYPDELAAIKRVHPDGQAIYDRHFQNIAQDIAREATGRGLRYQDIEGDRNPPDVGRLAGMLDGYMREGFVIAAGLRHMELYLIEDGHVQRHTNSVGRCIERRTLWRVGDARSWLYRYPKSKEPGNFEIIEGAMRLMLFRRADFSSAYFMCDRIITRDIFEQALAAIISS
jgi:hypothetical protein